MAQEGQTATNPRTGERVILRGGQWVPLGGAAPLPTATIPAAAPNEQAKNNADISNIGSTIVSRAVGDQKTMVDTAKSSLEVGELERRASQLGLTPEKYSEYRDSFTKLPFLQGQLDRLRGIYDQNFQGVNPLEYGSVRAVNDEFNTVSGSLRAYVAAALGLTGQQFNTPAEQEAFIGSILPAAGDRDSVIEGKFKTLQDLLSNAASKGQTYGFRWPTTIGVDAPSNDWRFAPAQEQQVRDLITANDVDPLVAARQVLELASQAQGGQNTYTDEQVRAYAEQIQRTREELKKPGAIYGGIDYNAPPVDAGQGSANGIVEGLLRGTGDIVEGAMSLPGILNDAGNALVNLTGIPQALGYQPLTTNTAGYTRELLGLPRSEGVVGEINRGVAGVLAPAGAIRTGGQLLSRGPALVDDLIAQAPKTGGQAVARSLAATPVTDSAVAAAGNTAAEIVRQEGGGALAQTGAALLAGTPAYGVARGTRFLTEPGGTGILAQEAKREGIDLLAADTGGTLGKSITAGANLSPLAAGPLEDAGERSVATVERAVGRNTENLGGVLSLPAAGDTVATASGRLVSETMAESGVKLDALRTAASGVRPPANKAVALLTERIDKLNSMPQRNAAEIAELEKLVSDLKKGVNLDGLRELRTDLRSGISFDGRVRASREVNFNKQLARLIGQDIEAGLQNNPDALAKYRDFNKFYSGRAEVMDAFEKVAGADRSGEQIVAAIKSMAGGKGDEKTLATVMRNMSDTEASGLRATLIDGLGRAKPDAPFDLGAFNRNWKSMPKSAKIALFGDGPVYESLDRIYRVASKMEASQRYAANPSGTARGLVGLTGPLVTAGPLVDYALDTFKGQEAGSLLFAATASALMAGGQRAYGKLLASPDFANWLSRAPKTNDPLKVKEYVARLATIATQAPDISTDVQDFQAQVEAKLPGAPKPALLEE